MEQLGSVVWGLMNSERKASLKVGTVPQADGKFLTVRDLDVEGITVLELMYELCKLDGCEVAGNPKNAFAAFDADSGVLDIYSQKREFVHKHSDSITMMLAALKCVQTEGASFRVSGDQVICTLNNVTAKGSTYGEAAIRAMAKQQFAAQS